MVVISVLITIMLMIMFLLYYYKYRGLRDAYLDARNAVDNVILSYNRQLKNDELILGQLREKVESMKDNRADSLQTVIGDLEGAKEKFLATSRDIDSKIRDIENRIEQMDESYNTLRGALDEIRTSYEEPKKDSERERIDSAIPIRATKALEPLNETELLVLKTLSQEGERSSSEIKERINLTREHSARLLKKLYEDGYLERSTKNKPFKYRVKNEMTGILKGQ